MTMLLDTPPPGRPRRRRRGGALLLLLGYLLAFAVPPLLGAAWSLGAALPEPPTQPALPKPLPAAPIHDPDKLTAVVVAGVTGAESIDVLVPYHLLAESGRFNVYTVAPRREPLPLFPGSPHLRGVAFLPHLTFAGYDERIGADPDVVVVPWVPSDEGNAPLGAWLRERTDDATLLTICGGSWTAAEAGVLDGRSATSHQNVLPLLRREHPSVRWIDGQRWVEDGDVVSSAGITAAFDATLRVLERHLGRDAAVDVAERLGYPHLRFLDDPRLDVAPASSTGRLLELAFRWERHAAGVALYDGIDEVALASVVDLYPRTHTTVVHPVGVDRRLVTSRHGLHLLPVGSLGEDGLTAAAQPPALDRLLVPGRAPEAVRVRLDRWAEDAGTPLDHLHAGAGQPFPIDAVVHDLARDSGRATATRIAAGIEYPIDGAELPGRAWVPGLLLRPLALGAVGLALAHAVARRRRAHTVPVP
jgi:putative intracellular protease/amidase